MAILNKKEFCKIINNLIKTEECIEELNAVFKKHNKDITLMSLLYNENIDIINILEIMFNDYEEYISYWIYELDFGEKYHDGCITENDGTNIILKTPENLYDFLIKEMTTKNENKS